MRININALFLIIALFSSCSKSKNEVTEDEIILNDSTKTLLRYSNGVLLDSATYVNGLLEGFAIHTDDSGNRLLRNFTHGEYEGQQLTYNALGILTQESFFWKGHRFGESSYYNDFGIPIRHKTYWLLDTSTYILNYEEGKPSFHSGIPHAYSYKNELKGLYILVQIANPTELDVKFNCDQKDVKISKFEHFGELGIEMFLRNKINRKVVISYDMMTGAPSEEQVFFSDTLTFLTDAHGNVIN